jgi:uncharacterized Fe-S cluster-containing protein
MSPHRGNYRARHGYAARISCHAHGHVADERCEGEVHLERNSEFVRQDLGDPVLVSFSRLVGEGQVVRVGADAQRVHVHVRVQRRVRARSEVTAPVEAAERQECHACNCGSNDGQRARPARQSSEKR